MNSLALNLSIQGWWHSWSWQVLMRHWGKVICWVLLSLICPENLLVLHEGNKKRQKAGRKFIHFLTFASEATNNPFKVSRFLFKCHKIQPHSWHHLILIRETEAQSRGIIFPGHQVLILAWNLGVPCSGLQRAGGTPQLGDLLLISSFFPHSHKSNATIFFLKLELNEPKSNLRK